VSSASSWGGAHPASDRVIKRTSVDSNRIIISSRLVNKDQPGVPGP
jgi:hypothetical protein